jgi:hypothetical protein
MSLLRSTGHMTCGEALPVLVPVSLAQLGATSRVKLRLAYLRLSGSRVRCCTTGKEDGLIDARWKPIVTLSLCPLSEPMVRGEMGTEIERTCVEVSLAMEIPRENGLGE